MCFMDSKLTIGKLAKIAGVGVETIRFYQRKKLLEMPSNKLSNTRYYSADAIEKIDFIKRAQSVGFSLSEIKDLLALRIASGIECAPIKEKTKFKILEIESKIAELKNILRALKKFESKCDGHEPTSRCSILDGLKGLKRG